jgi:hypothetical protein
MDISQLASHQLLWLDAQVTDELTARRITRSYNNPGRDLAEWLFCKAFE